jgi:hypothetical protein
MAIYNQSGVLYNAVYYNGAIEYIEIQNKIELFAYQNTRETIILYWKMIPYSQFLFSNDNKFKLEIDISPNFDSEFYTVVDLYPLGNNQNNNQNNNQKIYYNNIDNVLGVYYIINIEDFKVTDYSYHEGKKLYFRISVNIDNVSPKIISSYATTNLTLIPHFKFNLLTKIYSFLSKNIYKFPIIKISDHKYRYYDSNANLFNLYSVIIEELDNIISYSKKINIHPITRTSKDIIDLFTSFFNLYIENLGEIDQRILGISLLQAIKKSNSYSSIYDFIRNSIGVNARIYKTSEKFNLPFKNDDQIYYFTSNPQVFNKYYINNNRYTIGYDIAITHNNVDITNVSNEINEKRENIYKNILDKIKTMIKYLVPSYIIYRVVEE